MYITLSESDILDRAVKRTEVALRSFIADTLLDNYPTKDSFKLALNSISISKELIYSRRFESRLKTFIQNHDAVHKIIIDSSRCLKTKDFDNDVPYVSDLIDFILIFFNAHFSEKKIATKFSSVEEFHYCCTLFHKIRNNLSHPASRPIIKQDANKIVYFIEVIINAIEDKFFWFSPKNQILEITKEFKNVNYKQDLKISNLDTVRTYHRNLLCRDVEISNLTSALLGDEKRRRLAGSVVLYGYGGVGKTAITTDFLQRVLRDKKDGKYNNIEFILFFSSKDEYLRQNSTTGEFYIDKAKPEFSTLNELEVLICSELNINNLHDISSKYKGGIIAIDNLENIDQEEKNKIIQVIKELPREIQFVVTSRNEEQCEEKIHIQEFMKNDNGNEFINKIIESEEFNVAISNEEITKLLDASKGNALIIIQVLNSLHRGVSELELIIKSLESMRSKDSEMIANFMYKNTFDHALEDLTKKGYPAIEVIRLISLYNEKIELYSISKLVGIDVSVSEKLCNYLCERLVLNKTGEYYDLNDFAKRFVFIKLSPDRFQLSNYKDKIRSHKERMKKKLRELDDTLQQNSALHKNVTEWQPRNYIDKIIIAELFSLYGEAIKYLYSNNKTKYETYLKEFDDHSLITNHPFVPLQKARLLKEGLWKFYRHETAILLQVETLYEQALDSIEYDYRYLLNTEAEASLKMLLGIFLCEHRKQSSRAIRFLEEARNIFRIHSKPWFICCNYLSKCYLKMYIETNDFAYKSQLKKTGQAVLMNEQLAKKSGFRISKYKEEYSGYL